MRVRTIMALLLMLAASPALAQAPSAVAEIFLPGAGRAVGLAALDGGGAVIAVSAPVGPRVLRLDGRRRIVEDWTLSGSDAWPRAVVALPGAAAMVAGPARPVGFEHGVAVWRFVLADDGGLRQDWMRRFQRTSLDQAAGAVGLEDGGMVVAGSSGGAEGATVGVWVLRLAADGDVVWRRMAFPVADGGVLRATAVTRDPASGDILVAAYGSPGEHDPGASWILRFDLVGNERGQIVLDDAGDQHPAVLAGSDGGAFLVGGWVNSVEDATRSWAWLRRVETNGTVAWARSWQENSRSGAIHAAVALPDGGALVVGERDGQGWIARIGASGQTVWDKSVGGERLDSAALLRDGSVLATGESANAKGRPWAVRIQP